MRNKTQTFHVLNVHLTDSTETSADDEFLPIFYPMKLQCAFAPACGTASVLHFLRWPLDVTVPG